LALFLEFLCQQAGQDTGAPIPRPTEFAVNLKAYVDKVAGTCPLFGHIEIEKEESDEITNLLMSRLFLNSSIMF
jgi:hypothetical protein